MRNSLNTHLWIFSVGRGSAAFVRTGLNQGLILDMGGGDIFDPVKFVSRNIVPHLDLYDKRSIAQAILSHPHADHIAQCGAFRYDPLYPALLTCQNDKAESSNERINWSRLGADDPAKQKLLEIYRSLYDRRSLPLRTIRFASDRSVPNLEYGIYYLRPDVCEWLHPSDDNAYGNALSILFYLRHGQNTALFCGDMTPEGMAYLLRDGPGIEKRYSVLDRAFTESHPNWHDSTVNQYALRDLLGQRGLSVLVVAHHGLESCYSRDLFAALRGGRPSINVISERRKPREGQGQCHPNYQSKIGAVGLMVNTEGVAERRYSITTVGGHHILIVFTGSSNPRVFADRDPNRLLKYAV